MKKYIKNIINPFLIFSALLISSLLFSQTYVRVNQNRDWNADVTQSTVFFKADNSDLEITPSLNMLLFRDNDSNDDPKSTYGGSWVDTDTYSNHSPIPDGWTYEISNAAGDVPSNTTVSADKKKITYSGESPEEIDIYLKVIDADGNTINALGRVQLRLYIRGNFTVSQGEWSACKQQYIVEVNEIIVNGNYPCRPYRMIVYNSVQNGNSFTVDTSNVVFGIWEILCFI